jgi:hypothetical protein
MPPRKRNLLTARERVELLQVSLVRLAPNDAFQEFIDHLREIQRNTMLDLMNDVTVGDEKLTAAAIGELRAYEAIINLFDDYVATQVQQAVADEMP